METSSPETTRQKVERALAKCRPFLQEDGGDVELISVGDDGVVELLFHGTCVTCPMSRMTLRAGIERAVLESASEVKRVEALSPAKQ